MRTYPCGNAGLGPPAAAELETPWKGLKLPMYIRFGSNLIHSRTRNSHSRLGVELLYPFP